MKNSILTLAIMGTLVLIVLAQPAQMLLTISVLALGAAVLMLGVLLYTEIKALLDDIFTEK